MPVVLCFLRLFELFLWTHVSGKTVLDCGLPRRLLRHQLNNQRQGLLPHLRRLRPVRLGLGTQTASSSSSSSSTATGASGNPEWGKRYRGLCGCALRADQTRTQASSPQIHAASTICGFLHLWSVVSGASPPDMSPLPSRPGLKVPRGLKSKPQVSHASNDSSLQKSSRLRVGHKHVCSH